MNAKLELVRNWLIRAQHDLAAARKLATGPDPYLDVAVYHCQQAAEKAVKGFLVFHDQPFEKTHDVEVLVSLAQLRLHPILATLRSASLGSEMYPLHRPLVAETGLSPVSAL